MVIRIKTKKKEIEKRHYVECNITQLNQGIAVPYNSRGGKFFCIIFVG